jgi:hypothetical protein
MPVEQARSWPSTFMRGLLCVLLTMAFAVSAIGDRERHVECDKHDGVSDGGRESPTSWFGRGGPRIVKRLVGVDHLAINAVIPDEVAVAPSQHWEPAEIEPIHRRSDARRHGTSVRGPPARITIACS